MTQHTSPLDTVLSALSPMFGDRLSTERAIRDQHTAVESWLTPAAPDAVVMVHSTDEVSAVLKLCHAHGVPVVPFGAGSSMAAGFATGASATGFRSSGPVAAVRASQ